MALIDMSREEHYEAIEKSLADADKVMADLKALHKHLSRAQVHATLLVEKAVRGD